MSNTEVKVQGYILSANVIEPEEHIYWEHPKYMLQIAPYNSYEAFEIERRIKELKMQDRQFIPDHYGNPQVHKESWMDGATIRFEGLYKPRLMGELATVENDYQLMGKFVQAVGHVQIQENKFAYIPIDLIEPKMPPHTLDVIDWDDPTVETDDIF